MGKENEEKPVTEGEKPQVEAPKAGAKTEAAPPPKPAAGEKPVTETKGATTTDAGPKRHRLGADDDDIPDDADLIELSQSALKKRLARNTSKELKARFGTADLEDIKKKLDRAAELEKNEEERKRAEMSEREKLEADLKKERALRTDAERRANRVHEDRVVEREETRVTKLAEKFIDVDPDVTEVVYRRFAKWLKTEFTDEQLKTLKDSKIEGWFKTYAAEHPKHAKAAPAGDGEGGTETPEKPAVKKVPLNNGAKPGDKPAPSKGETSGQRTYSPSAPGAMTTNDARAAAAKEGYRW